MKHQDIAICNCLQIVLHTIRRYTQTHVLGFHIVAVSTIALLRGAPTISSYAGFPVTEVLQLVCVLISTLCAHIVQAWVADIVPKAAIGQQGGLVFLFNDQ